MVLLFIHQAQAYESWKLHFVDFYFDLNLWIQSKAPKFKHTMRLFADEAVLDVNLKNKSELF